MGQTKAPKIEFCRQSVRVVGRKPGFDGGVNLIRRGLTAMKSIVQICFTLCKIVSCARMTILKVDLHHYMMRTCGDAVEPLVADASSETAHGVVCWPIFVLGDGRRV